MKKKSEKKDNNSEYSITEQPKFIDKLLLVQIHEN